MSRDDKTTIDMVEKQGEVAITAPHDAPNVSFLQSLKEHPKPMIMGLLMSLGPMAFGFDIIILGVVTVFPAFLQRFGELHGEALILPSVWLALWNASMQIGFMIGSIVNGWVADRFGRKISIMAGALVTSAGVAIVYTSDLSSDMDHRRGAFLAGKIVLGIGLSMMATTCLIYNSEIVPTKLRGVSLSMFQFNLVLGQLVAAVVAGSQIPNGLEPIAYRICFATQWAMAGAAFIAAFFVPESPAWLLRRGDIEGARRSFARLHDAASVEASVVAMQALLEHEREELQASDGVTWAECFRGSNWRRMRIIIFASTVQQCMGLSFVANGTYFMIVAGLSPTNSITVLEIASGLALVGNIISWYLAARAGRRRTIIACTAFLSLVWLSVGIAGCFTTYSALWYMGVMINMVLVFFNIGAGPIIPIIVAETSSVRLRAKANAVGFMCNGFASWAFNFFVPYMFNSDKGNLGGKTGFFFAGLCIVAVVVLFFDLPEMKNRTYRELDDLFEKKVKTRDFRKYQVHD
ncbi:general substrate transporter [Dactylonectria macrodidyma]|uniref:General substrate transporter n=1 Tax=Dactylonectria macrodidyma TaxID=307937 RepID=A0A9P9D0I4_9HYPO|nr:general substrate transporter [Dactylonectria macrodidyma]